MVRKQIKMDFFKNDSEIWTIHSGETDVLSLENQYGKVNILGSAEITDDADGLLLLDSLIQKLQEVRDNIKANPQGPAADKAKITHTVRTRNPFL